MFSGSKERVREMAFVHKTRTLSNNVQISSVERSDKIEQWAQQLHMFLCQRYGKENVIAMIAHLDIERPEIIAVVLAVGASKGFSYNEMFAGNDSFDYRSRNIDLHDKLYVEVNKAWGLERGERRSVPVGHLYTATTVEVEVLEKMDKDTKTELITKQAELQILNEEFTKAERRVKGLTTMLSNLEAQKKDLETKIEEFELQVSQHELEDLNRRHDLLKEEWGSLNYKIKEREIQLVKGREELQDVADKLSEKRKIVDTLMKNNPLHSSKVNEEIIKKMRATMWKEFVKDSRRQYDAVMAAPKNINYLSRKNYQELIEKSSLKYFMNSGELIVSIATAIYLGDLTQANKLAGEKGMRTTSLQRGQYFGNKEFIEACFNEALSMVKQKED